MRSLDRFFVWWGRRHEPVRFLLVMLAIGLMVFPLNLGLYFGNAMAVAFGLVMVVLLVVLTIARVRWLRRPPNLKDFTRSRL